MCIRDRVCNDHLSVEQQIDHRSYARQGKLEIPTIHEGADARKIDEKFQSGQVQTASWKVEENQIIKRQNALLKKIQTSFGKVSGALSQWKEWLNDLRRKPGSHSHDGVNDKPDRGTAEAYGRDGKMCIRDRLDAAKENPSYRHLLISMEMSI